MWEKYFVNEGRHKNDGKSERDRQEKEIEKFLPQLKEALEYFSKLNEVKTALEEIDKSKGDIFKIIGQIMKRLCILDKLAGEVQNLHLGKG